jgi:hypothetical protein
MREGAVKNCQTGVKIGGTPKSGMDYKAVRRWRALQSRRMSGETIYAALKRRSTTMLHTASFRYAPKLLPESVCGTTHRDTKADSLYY